MTELYLHSCYNQIPSKLQHAPLILDAVARHPLLCDLKFCYEPRPLLEALFLRVSDRETLRECVRYAQTDKNAWQPQAWGRIPQALWNDKALCLELLAMLPPLYCCLPDHLQSDPDVVEALVVATPDYYCDWEALLFLVPAELQLQFPDLVLRILWECRGSDTVADALAPDLRLNPEVVLALLRCYHLAPPERPMPQFDSDEELWFRVATGDNRDVFDAYCPSKLRHDRIFLLRAVRAKPDRCLDYATDKDLQLDFDLILTACAMKAECAESVVDRFLCFLGDTGAYEKRNDELYDERYDEPYDEGEEERLDEAEDEDERKDDPLY